MFFCWEWATLLGRKFKLFKLFDGSSNSIIIGVGRHTLISFLCLLNTEKVLFCNAQSAHRSCFCLWKPFWWLNDLKKIKSPLRPHLQRTFQWHSSCLIRLLTREQLMLLRIGSIAERHAFDCSLQTFELSACTQFLSVYVRICNGFSKCAAALSNHCWIFRQSHVTSHWKLLRAGRCQPTCVTCLNHRCI
jgi:hypothetical protein